jgi:hypothetical protein
MGPFIEASGDPNFREKINPDSPFFFVYYNGENEK